MQNRATKNLYEIRNTPEFTPDTKSAVFISYKQDPDRDTARECADIIESAGLYYWLDVERVPPDEDDVRIAICIEEGLDAASALLGIIGPETFNSSWVPYETGGARGRQRFKDWLQGDLRPEEPHPLIAHFIYDPNISGLPAFIELGTPLRCLCEVQEWAAYIAEVLQQERRSLYEVKSIQRRHKIHEIYERNINYLRSK